MKKNSPLIVITLSCLLLSSCTDFTPTADNNFVMMRSNDIQLKQDVIDHQKHVDNPSHRWDFKRFLRELFCPKKSCPDQNALTPTK